jgi:hypothetical protein
MFLFTHRACRRARDAGSRFLAHHTTCCNHSTPAPAAAAPALTGLCNRAAHALSSVSASGHRRFYPRVPTASTSPFCLLRSPSLAQRRHRVAAASSPGSTSPSSSSSHTLSTGGLHCSDATPSALPTLARVAASVLAPSSPLPPRQQRASTTVQVGTPFCPRRPQQPPRLAVRQQKSVISTQNLVSGARYLPLCSCTPHLHSALCTCTREQTLVFTLLRRHM